MRLINAYYIMSASRPRPHIGLRRAICDAKLLILFDISKKIKNKKCKILQNTLPEGRWRREGIFCVLYFSFSIKKSEARP